MEDLIHCKVTMKATGEIVDVEWLSPEAPTPEKIFRTVYVCNLDTRIDSHLLMQSLEEQGRVVDCKVCQGRPKNFAFVEFEHQATAAVVVRLGKIVVDGCEATVRRSKTVIGPVTMRYMPSTSRQRDAVSRTVFVTNVHRNVNKTSLRNFFNTTCGIVTKIRVLDHQERSTKAALVEFKTPKAADTALECTATFSDLCILVSPSKTFIA